jgi:hypothetical protein
VIAYLSLQEGLERQSAMADEYRAAMDLRSVVEDRFRAGLESQIEMKDACRTEVQVRLQKLQLVLSQFSSRVLTPTMPLQADRLFPENTVCL